MSKEEKKDSRTAGVEVVRESSPAFGPKTPVGRRAFVAGACGAGAMLALGLTGFAPRRDVCRPPGGQDEGRFLGACIRCGRCMEACPNNVVVPSPIEDGIASMRTPKLNFSQSSTRLDGNLGWCDHCLQENGGVARCVEVCPSGALRLPEDSTFETMRLGKARITKDWCLAWLLKGCTVCFNACPTDAISLDEMNRPVIDEALCNGCGACEQACVSLTSVSLGEGESRRTMDARAITVHVEGE